MDLCFLNFGPLITCDGNLSPFGEIIDPGFGDGYLVLEGTYATPAKGKGSSKSSKGSKGGKGERARALSSKSSDDGKGKSGSGKGKEWKGYSFPEDEIDGIPMPVYISPMAIDEIEVSFFNCSKHIQMITTPNAKFSV